MPRIISGRDEEGNAWFEFKAHTLAEVTRVEWPEGPVAVLPAEIATVMLKQRYAHNLTDQVLEEYNRLVDEHNARAPTDVPMSDTPPPVATNTKAPETPVAPVAPVTPEVSPAPPPADDVPPPPPPPPAPPAETVKVDGVEYTVPAGVSVDVFKAELEKQAKKKGK